MSEAKDSTAARNELAVSHILLMAQPYLLEATKVSPTPCLAGQLGRNKCHLGHGTCHDFPGANSVSQKQTE